MYPQAFHAAQKMKLNYYLEISGFRKMYIFYLMARISTNKKLGIGNGIFQS